MFLFLFFFLHFSYYRMKVLLTYRAFFTVNKLNCNFFFFKMRKVEYFKSLTKFILPIKLELISSKNICELS